MTAMMPIEQGGEDSQHLMVECLQRRCYVVLSDCSEIGSGGLGRGAVWDPPCEASSNLGDNAAASRSSPISVPEDLIIKQEPLDDVNFLGISPMEGCHGSPASTGRLMIGDIQVGDSSKTADNIESLHGNEFAVDVYNPQSDLLPGLKSDVILEITSLSNHHFDGEGEELDQSDVPLKVEIIGEDSNEQSFTDGPGLRLPDASISLDGIFESNTSGDVAVVKSEPLDSIIYNDIAAFDEDERFEVDDAESDDQSVTVVEPFKPVFGDAFLKSSSLNARKNSAVLQPPYSYFSSDNLQQILFIRQCPYCDEEVNSTLQLINHIADLHKMCDDRFQCPQLQCGGSYELAHEVLTHLVQTHHTDIKFICLICNLQSDSFPQAKVHLDSHGAACLLCGLDLDHGYYLDDHLREIHSDFACKLLECDYCEYNFASAGLLKDHVRVHFGMAKICCKFCGGWFNEMFKNSGICHHIKSHHKTSKPLECPECKSFKTHHVKFLIAHWRNACSKFRCDECKCHYRWTCGGIYYHKKICGREETRFKCQECSVYFKTKSHLQSHFIVKHNRQNGLHCPIEGCSFVTGTKQKYQQHIFRHHGITEGVSEANKLACATIQTPGSQFIRPREKSLFPCKKCLFPLCGYVETEDVLLKNHVLEQHRPHVKFSSSEGRYGHSSKKNAICPDCGHLLRDQFALNQHQISAHGHGKSPRYNCKECDVQFRVHHEYNKHMDQLHRQVKIRQSRAAKNTTMVIKAEPEAAFDYNCTICDYVTNSKILFTRHQASKIHRGRYMVPKNAANRVDKCPLCDYTPSMKSGSKAIPRHLFVHYRNGETIPEGFSVDIHKCKLCNHETCDAGHLRRHMNVHFRRGDTLPNEYVVTHDDTLPNEYVVTHGGSLPSEYVVTHGDQ